MEENKTQSNEITISKFAFAGFREAQVEWVNAFILYSDVKAKRKELEEEMFDAYRADPDLVNEEDWVLERKAINYAVSETIDEQALAVEACEDLLSKYEIRGGEISKCRALAEHGLIPEVSLPEYLLEVAMVRLQGRDEI